MRRDVRRVVRTKKSAAIRIETRREVAIGAWIVVSFHRVVISPGSEPCAVRTAIISRTKMLPSRADAFFIMISSFTSWWPRTNAGHIVLEYSIGSVSATEACREDNGTRGRMVSGVRSCENISQHLPRAPRNRMPCNRNAREHLPLPEQSIPPAAAGPPGSSTRSYDHRRTSP